MSKDFFTTQRKNILISAAVAAIILIVIGLNLPQDSGWSSLAINLASAAIGTGLTITFVDYMIRQENQLSVADGSSMAAQDVKALYHRSVSTSVELYGFDVRVIRFPKEKENALNEYLAATETGRLTYLRQMGEEGDLKKIDASRVKKAADDFADISQKLDWLLLKYSYAISNKAKGKLLKFSKHLNEVERVFGIHAHIDMDGPIKILLVEMNKEAEEALKYI